MQRVLATRKTEQKKSNDMKKELNRSSHTLKFKINLERSLEYNTGKINEKISKIDKRKYVELENNLSNVSHI